MASYSTTENDQTSLRKSTCSSATRLLGRHVVGAADHGASRQMARCFRRLRGLTMPKSTQLGLQLAFVVDDDEARCPA